MQRAPTAVDIDGHVVHIGATVQVKWLGVWYEGTVIKVGPKRNLCMVRDVSSKETILLESKHLKFMETRVMDKRMSPGTRVVYKDGEHWQEGVVESCCAEGVAMVSWRKSGLSEENLTWFEFSHFAPVIQNEAYKGHNRDLLEAGKSGLLQNDAIEPRPRTMDNMLYESESDQDEDLLNELAVSRSSPIRSRGEHSKNTTQQEAVHSFEEPTENGKRKSDSTHLPLPPPSFPFPPPPMFMPMMYLPVNQNHYMKMSPSFVSAHSFQSLPHPRSLKKPGLSHTSTPCIMSYTKPTNGIPPHPSSKFFQKICDAKLGKRKLSNPSRPRAKSRLKKSPTLESRAHSEPTHYATIPELAEFSSKHPAKIPKHKKSPKKILPTAVEQNAETFQTSSHSHHHTKHSPHSSQPPTLTSSPGYPHLHSPAQNMNQPGKEHSLTVPPPLPPHPYKSPGSAAITPRQPTTQESLPREDSHLLNVGRTRRSTRQRQEQEVWEEDEVRHTDLEPQPQSPEKGATLEMVSTSPAHVTVPHGGSILLTCLARSPRIVNYEWLKDTQPLSEHDPFFTQPAPGMLQIEMAPLSLTGEYKCVVSDNHSSFERVFHLNVCPNTQASEGQGAGTAEASQPQFTNKVTHEGVNMEIPLGVMTPESLASSTHPHRHPPHREPPIIIVEEPQSESISPTLHQSPESRPSSSGRDTPDIRDEGRAKGEDGSVTMKQEVTKGRKSAKRNRHRVSNALKNDMELYLDGYGEDYGALSLKVNFELEPWLEDLSEEEEGMREKSKRRVKGKKKKKKSKKSSSQGSSSPTKSSGSVKKPESFQKSTKNVSFSKLPTVLLGKNKKKQQVEAEKTPSKPVGAWQENQTKASEDPTAELEAEETNSVAVHTSVGASTGSVVTLGGGEGEVGGGGEGEEGGGGEGEEGGGGRLQLPQEQESLSDSVRRLQLSVQEYCPEQLKFAEKEKKKGFLSSIFSSKNK